MKCTSVRALQADARDARGQAVPPEVAGRCPGGAITGRTRRDTSGLSILLTLPRLPAAAIAATKPAAAAVYAGDMSSDGN
jgi:hypothetical protein